MFSAIPMPASCSFFVSLARSLLFALVEDFLESLKIHNVLFFTVVNGGYILFILKSLFE